MTASRRLCLILAFTYSSPPSDDGQGLEYSDGYREPMDRTLAYLEDHVEEAMQSFGGTEPVSIV